MVSSWSSLLSKGSRPLARSEPSFSPPTSPSPTQGLVPSPSSVHDRVICLPKNEDDTVNEEALSQVVKDLLKSVKDRESMGLLGFRDPDAVDDLAANLDSDSEEEG